MNNGHDAGETEICISFGTSLKLQQLHVADAPALFQLIERNRAHLRQFLGWLDHNTSVQDTFSFIEKEQ